MIQKKTLNFKKTKTNRILYQNKRANFDYQILETFQAGLSLDGILTKMVRNKILSLDKKYVIWNKDRLQIINFGNSNYSQNISLLLHKNEIIEIKKNLQIKGRTCIVLNLKTVGRWIKAEIAIVLGRKKYDKKEYLKQREQKKELKKDINLHNLN